MGRARRGENLRALAVDLARGSLPAFRVRSEVTVYSSSALRVRSTGSRDHDATQAGGEHLDAERARTLGREKKAAGYSSRGLGPVGSEKGPHLKFRSGLSRLTEATVHTTGTEAHEPPGEGLGAGYQCESCSQGGAEQPEARGAGPDLLVRPGRAEFCSGSLLRFLHWQVRATRAPTSAPSLARDHDSESDR